MFVVIDVSETLNVDTDIKKLLDYNDIPYTVVERKDIQTKRKDVVTEAVKLYNDEIKYSTFVSNIKKIIK